MRVSIPNLLFRLLSGLLVNLFIGGGLHAEIDNVEVTKLSSVQTKTVLIYHFLKNTQWPKEGGLAEFTVGLYGDYPALHREMAVAVKRMQVRGRPVVLKLYSDVESAKQAQLLIVVPEQSPHLAEITQQLLQTATLVVSDDAPNRRVAMINFTYPSSQRLAFELNKSNIVYEGLTVSKDILLHGGTEMDVAVLYKEMEQALSGMRQQLGVKRQELEGYAREIQQQGVNLEQRNKQVNQAEATLLAQEQELKQQSGQLEAYRYELEASKQAKLASQREVEENKQQLSSVMAELSAREAKIEQSEDVVLGLEQKIAANQATLDSQQAIIADKEQLIAVQNERGDAQNAKIVAQQRLLYGSVVSFVLLLLLTVALLNSRRQKHLVAKQQKVLEAEAKVVKAQAEAIEAYESNLVLKKEFLAVVSHEFRTPMNGVIGSLELLRSGSGASSDDYLDIIDDSSQEMMGLINDLLIYTEVQSEQLKNHPVTTAMTCCFADLYKRYLPVCTQKHLSLSWNVSPAVEDWWLIDGDKLTLVLGKLMDNAVKFTDKGGIVFTADIVDENDGFLLRCSVEDSGIGIDASNHSKVFESFTQAEAGFDRGFPGLGIGLAISQQLVNVMGGALTISSEQDSGSRFNVCLPLAKSEPMVLDDPANNSVDLLKRPVLVVEDNLVNQKIIQKMLQRLGFQSLIANHGEEALAIMKEQSVSAVLMDLQMPIMDGFSCTEAIRKREDITGDIPIIAVTANLTDTDKERCFQVGIDAYLSKPLRIQVLQETLYKYLSKYAEAAS